MAERRAVLDGFTKPKPAPPKPASTATKRYAWQLGPTRKGFKARDLLEHAVYGDLAVKVTAAAWKAMFEQQDTGEGRQRPGGPVELGGGLFGHLKSGVFHVEDAIGRVQPDSATRNSCLLDLAFIRRRAEDRRARGQHLLGYWHSHPVVDTAGAPTWVEGARDEDYGLALPSQADMDSLGVLYEKAPTRSGHPARWPALGLILAPRRNDEDGWIKPLLTAFISRGEETYPAVEFARAEVEGKPRATAFVPNRWKRS